MNILQEIDSTLHYENLEKAWHKYKFVFILTLVAIFAGVAGFNAYNTSIEKQSKNDTTVIFEVIMQKAQSENYIHVIEKSLEKLETTTGSETLKLELAKAYKVDAKLDMYVKTLTELTMAKTQAVKHISTYMLAEHFLATDAKKCERCWHYSEDVGVEPAHPEICGRCVSNVDGEGEKRQFA